MQVRDRLALTIILSCWECAGGDWNFSSIRFVHVDDVARAQIFLSEYPDAKGRYICSAHDIQTDKLIEFLSSKYPEYHKPSLE